MSAWGFFVTWSLLLLSLTATVVGSCSDPSINPAHLVVEYGGVAEANCSSVGEPSMVGWIIGGVQKDDMKQSHNTLEVKSFMDWNMGKIQCFVLSDVGGHCSTDLNITMYKIPDAVAITSESTASLTEGESVELTCVITNVAPLSNLQVNWFRGQEPISPTVTANSTNDRVPSQIKTFTQSINVTASRNHPQALYFCEAELKLEGLQSHPKMRSKDFAVLTNYAPVVQCTETKVKIQENSTLPKCTVDGYPLPNISWFKDRIRVNKDSPLGRADGGRYTILVSNSMGIVNDTVDVEILYGPELNCPARAQVKENQHLPNCTALGNPLPQLNWIKGHPVDPQKPLSRRQSGEYIIIAKSGLGSVARTIDIQILFGPEIKCPSRVEVRENQTLKDCMVEGNPSPQVMWYRDSTKVHSLLQRVLDRSDGGHYTIIADTKDHFEVHHTVEVIVISESRNIAVSTSCLLLLFCHLFH